MNDYPFPIPAVRAMDLQPDGTYLLWVDCVRMPGRYADCYAAQDAANLLDAETLGRLHQDTLARGDAAITHVDVLRAAMAAERDRYVQALTSARDLLRELEARAYSSPPSEAVTAPVMRLIDEMLENRK